MRARRLMYRLAPDRGRPERLTRGATPPARS